MNIFRYLKVAASLVAVGTLGNILTAWEKDWNWSFPLFITNVVLFTVSGVVTTYLMDTRRLPLPLLRFMDTLAAVNRQEIRRFTAPIVRDYPMLVFGVIAVIVLGCTVPASDSLSEPAQMIYGFTYKIGMAWLIIRMLWITVTSVVETVSPLSTVVAFAEQIVLFALALVAVRTFGAELSDLVVSTKANPDIALTVVAALVVLRSVFALTPERQITIARDNGAYGVAIAGRPKSKQRAATDIFRTAIHESGHLLLYACLSELPSRLSVEVDSTFSANDVYRGRVRDSGKLPDVMTEQFNHWAMLMYLAGAEAERLVYGERADGAYGDNKNWIQFATSYLTSGFGEVFYTEPVTDAQIAHNRAVLNDLKAKCISELADFLGANHSLLHELAETIKEQEFLPKEEIEPYLKRVINFEKLPTAAYAFEHMPAHSPRIDPCRK